MTDSVPGPTAADPFSPKKYAVVQHLLSYPIVDATVSYTSSLPLVKKVSGTAKPYVEKYVAPALERASPVLSKVDRLGDSTLSTVDKFIPALKSTQAPDIPGTVSKSVESVKNTTSLYKEAARAKVNDSLVEPTVTAVEKARQRTASLYDAKGRPFVRATVDPVLAPLNSRLVALIDAHLPPSKPLEGEATAQPLAPATELGRLYLISQDVVIRVKPMVEDRLASTKQQGETTIAHVVAIPSQAMDHILAVWNDKKTKADFKAKPITAPFYVTLSTGKQIAFEMVNYAEIFAQEQVKHVKMLANGVFKESKAEIAAGTPDGIPEAVDGSLQ